MHHSPSQSEPAERQPQRVADRELILRFAGQGDQAAFRTLVERHGALVFRVCRGILRHHQDAEDAFQATFLVLARKAGKVHWHESLANWLYGTARRIALKANSRLQKEERQAMAEELETLDVFEQVAARDAERTLHEELDQLPEQLRAPLILCYLEGKTQNEAAADLAVPPSTINGRLQRGRQRLRVQLARRGIGLAFPAAAAGTTLSIQPAGAASLSSTSLMASSEPLVSSTVQAATEFASGLAPSGAASAQALTLANGEIAMFTSTTVFKLSTATAALLAVIGVSWLLLSSDASAEGPEALLPLATQLVGEPIGAPQPPTEIAAESPFDAAAESDVYHLQRDSILVVGSTKTHVISVFSAHTGNWHQQPYEPSAGEEVVPYLFGSSLSSLRGGAEHVVFHAGNRAYGFSGVEGTWQSVELPEGEPVEKLVVHNDLAAFQAGNRIYGFSGQSGTWDSFEVPKDMRVTTPGVLPGPQGGVAFMSGNLMYVKVGDTWYAFSSLAPDPKWVAMNFDRTAEGVERGDD